MKKKTHGRIKRKPRKQGRFREIPDAEKKNTQRKKELSKLAIQHEEGKKDYKQKSYLDKDTEKQVATTQIGNVKKYKSFPKHMNWHTGRVKSDEYKDLRKREADYITAHGGEGFKKGGRAGYRGGGRTRLLEELGRVEAEPSNRNRRAEISRVHSELNKGYKSGGVVLKGKKVGCQIK